jgi:hypothetical protein
MSRIGAKFPGAVALVLSALLACAATAHAQPTLAPSTVVAGPSSAIVSLGGLSIARDGTGGLVFVEQVAGVNHVFVSRLINGSFQAPTQLDSGLAGASSQPVIGTANSGAILVAFINAGELYVDEEYSTSTGFGAPQALIGGASNPAISVTTFPKAYVAFTETDAAGTDVRAAYYTAGQWSLEASPLNAVASGDDAGSRLGRPAVAAAGDGTAIVAWGEDGHVFARRVLATTPSTYVEQADPSSVDGLTEVSADEPSVGSGGDSSYADVGFRETLQNGAVTQTRALMSRLIAGSFVSPVGADGLTSPDIEGGAEPQVVMGEYGRGFLLTARDTSHELFDMGLETNGAPGAVNQLDTGIDLADPLAVGGTAGLFSTLAAWQQTSIPGDGEVMVAFGTDGGIFGQGQVASNPNDGPTDAAAGIAAAGDVAGDAAAAWVQGSGGQTEIDAAQLYQPPGSLAPTTKTVYTNNPEPTFSWSAARDSWGAIAYGVTANGVPVGVTGGLSLRPSAPLPDGVYRWQVTAVNKGGVSSTAKAATVHIDTLAPIVHAALSGRRRVGDTLRLTVTYADLRPGEPASDSSGVVSATVTWGDGTSAKLSKRSVKRHVYRTPGFDKVTVTVRDRAGNVTRIVHTVRIRKPPARHHKRGHK